MARNKESEATINRFLAEQVRANTLSACHYEGLKRLPGKKKQGGNSGKIVLGVCILLSAFILYQAAIGAPMP